MTKNPIAATAVSLLALGLALGVTPAMAAKMDVTIGMQLEPPNLDPTGGAAAAIDEVVYANVFEGLTRFGADGSILPALAKSWEISEDGLTYTFMLNEGVKFHDGTDFNAEDVKFSLDRARADDSTNAQKALFADIASVEVVDPATVKVTLSKPNGSFLFNMAWGDAVIVAPESAADNAANPVGTGPFTLTEWVKGDRVELGRYDGYWGTPVKLDKVTFKFISDPTAAFAAMMAGDLDAYPAFPAPGKPGPVRGRSAFRGDGRLVRGRDHSRHEQQEGAARQHQGARGDRPCDRPPGDHRRCHVRLRHADRHPFRSA
jgi:peptide/nickel transport system substrate-binding protein